MENVPSIPQPRVEPAPLPRPEVLREHDAALVREGASRLHEHWRYNEALVNPDPNNPGQPKPKWKEVSRSEDPELKQKETQDWLNKTSEDRKKDLYRKNPKTGVDEIEITRANY